MSQQIMISDLFEVIGRQTMKIELLGKYITQLEAIIKLYKEGESEEKKKEPNGILVADN